MWEIALITLIPLGYGGAAVWSSVKKYRRRRYWRDAAVTCALQETQIFGLGWWGFEVRGRQGRLEVRIDEAGSTSRARISIEVPGPADFHAVRIRPEWTQPPPRAREIEIGDPSFDDTLSLQGPKQTLCALLDAETRRLLYRANAETRLEIVKGWLRAEVPHEEVSRILPLLLDISQRFVQSMDAVQQRLAENATRDPVAGVRLQNLLLLIRETSRPAAIVEVLRTACADSNPEIQLRAAEALGGEARGVLLRRAPWAASVRLRPYFRSGRPPRAPSSTATSAEPRAKRSPRSNPASRVPRQASCLWPEPKWVSCRWPRTKRANCRSPPTRAGSSRFPRRSRARFRSATMRKG